MMMFKTGIGIAIHIANAIQVYRIFAKFPKINFPTSVFHMTRKIIIAMIIPMLTLRLNCNFQVYTFKIPET